MLYFLPYSLLLLFFGVLALCYNVSEETIKRRISVVSFFTLMFFFAFRGFTWDDWQVYYPVFHDMSISDLNFNFLAGGKEHSYEPFFTLLVLSCKSITSEYVFFQFICSFINISLLFTYIIRKGYNVPFFIMIFLTFGGYEIMINLLRNSIAILLFLNATIYIEKKRPIEYFILCTIALLFHVSSLTFFPLYFILRLRINRWVYLAIFGISALLFVSQIKLASILLETLSNDGKVGIMMEAYSNFDESKKLSIGFLERLFTGIMVFLYHKELIEHRTQNRIGINALLFYFCSLFLLSELRVVSERIALLFIFGYWFIWYDLISVIQIKNNKTLFGILIGVYCFYKMVGVTNYIRCDYDNHLFGAKTYQERMYIYNRHSTDSQ